jgi:hypothetical protein
MRIPVEAGRTLSSFPINRLPGANQLKSEIRDLVGTLDVRGRREAQGGSVLIPQERLPRTGGIDDSPVVAR